MIGAREIDVGGSIDEVMSTLPTPWNMGRDDSIIKGLALQTSHLIEESL